jgi:hypothetical protein
MVLDRQDRPEVFIPWPPDQVTELVVGDALATLSKVTGTPEAELRANLPALPQRPPTVLYTPA